MSESAEQRHLLEALVLDPEFELLERAVARFNLFEAVGVVRQELRHSDFLGFLLDPRQTHGLSDRFLKRILREALLESRGVPRAFSLIDLDCWSLEDTQVLREWSNIDILLLNQRLSVVVIFENKVGSAEHSDQLRRYRSTVESTYPGWRCLGIFLSPKGEAASHDDYISISYGSVVKAIEELLDGDSSGIDPMLKGLLTHYNEMVRRHVVNRSEIDDICARLYQRHRRALDLIYERRQGPQATIREILEGLVEADSDVVFDFSNSRWVSFVLREWDVPELRTGTYGGFGAENRVLLFWLEITSTAVNLQLQVCPCPLELAESIVQGVSNTSSCIRVNRLRGSWIQLYRDQWLSPSELQRLELDELRAALSERWQRFREGDLPRIREAFQNAPWQVLSTSPQS